MFQWLTSEAQATSEICNCRGEMEVMESQLLMSVNTISRMVDGDREIHVDGEIAGGKILAPIVEDGEAWWI